jgi:hypothetical protein
MRRGRWLLGLKVIVPVLAAAALGWWLLHPRPSDEELILQLAAKAEHGVETHSVDEIMSCVSPDFTGEAGMDRNDLWRLAVQWAHTDGEADVTINDYAIDVRSGEATGRFDVTVVAQVAGAPTTPMNMQLVVEFEKRWRRLTKVWLVKSVKGYQPERLFQDYL